MEWANSAFDKSCPEVFCKKSALKTSQNSQEKVSFFTETDKKSLLKRY